MNEINDTEAVPRPATSTAFDEHGEPNFGLPLSAYGDFGGWDGWPICKAVDSDSEDWRDHYVVTGQVADGLPAVPYIYHGEGFVLSVEDADRKDVVYGPHDVHHPGPGPAYTGVKPKNLTW